MSTFNGLVTLPFEAGLAPQGYWGWFGLKTKLGGGQFAPPQSNGGYPNPQVFDALNDWGQDYYFDGSGLGTSYIKFGDYNNAFGNMYLDVTFQGSEIWLRSEINQIYRLGWLNIEPYQGIAQIGMSSSSTFIGVKQYTNNGASFYVSSDLIAIDPIAGNFLRIVDENGNERRIQLV